MKKYLAILAAVVTLTACNPEEKQASLLYQQAEQAYQNEQYAYANALLDSIENHYKSAIEWRKAGHALNYQVQLAMQEDSLATADTMLLAITPIINEMVKANNFLYEKGEYDELGRFYAKGSDTQSNLGRSYVHASVNEYGVVSLISEYRGGAYINHTQLRLIGSDGTQVVTANVPVEHEGANYHFKNQGLCHESVTYVNDSALAFVDMQVGDSKLKAELLYQDGTKKYPVQLTAKDRNDIALTYQLGKMLAAQLRFTQQSKVAGEKIKFLKAKIETNKNKDNKK